MPVSIRDATPADAPACAAIYAPYVTDTTVSLETEPPTVAELGERMATAQRDHAWLVLEDDGVVTGYAYGGRFAPRAGYRWACETSIYLAPGRHRTGGGRGLYEALLPRLEARGYRMAVAVMTLPNDPSEGLHRALGFVPAGRLQRVAYKQGRWLDVSWMQRPLGPATGDDAPAEPAQ